MLLVVVVYCGGESFVVWPWPREIVGRSEERVSRSLSAWMGERVEVVALDVNKDLVTSLSMLSGEWVEVLTIQRGWIYY